MYNEEAPFQQNRTARNAIIWSESMRGNNSILPSQQAVYDARENNPTMMLQYPSPDQINAASVYALQQQRQAVATMILSGAAGGRGDRSQGWNNIDLSRLLLPPELDIQTAISQARMTSLLSPELDIQTATTLTRMMLERNTNRPSPQRMAPVQESGDRMTGSSIPLSLPTSLARSIDSFRMTEHQYYLRQQIEVFQANAEDVSTHIRGRNKPILLGQVGIRCRHCAHVPVMRRQKGSTYYPSNKYGIYQAAQNMSTTHLQCSLCSEMPDSVKMEFARILTEKNKSSCMGAGRPYWTEKASQLGLVDTEDAGIRFISNQPTG